MGILSLISMCNNVALLLTSHLPSMQSRGRDLDKYTIVYILCLKWTSHLPSMQSRGQ
jgi:hypothetical protein